MSDEYSKRILGCSVVKGRTVEEICLEQGIPQSTCYKRVRQLVQAGVMIVERIAASYSGQKYAVYRSVFSRMDVSWENGAMLAYATVNPEVSDKLRYMRQNEGDEP